MSVGCVLGLVLAASVSLHGEEQRKPPITKDTLNDKLHVIRAGFEERVELMFRSEAGQPLDRAEKRPPLKPGRGNYVRHYSYSICEFAARCFYLNEQLDQANAALIENAQHYLDHPKDISDRDSFHWHIDVVLRLIEQYGTNGSIAPGRLQEDTEEKLLEPAWIYAKSHSRLSDAEIEESQTWHIWESENHHVQIFTTAWHFAKLANNRPRYRRMTYDDGGTVGEHYTAWTAYLKAYCAERARKGLVVEMQNDGYNGILLKGLYNVYDFARDDVLKAQVGRFLNMYWAYWAQEQIDGVQGGGRARVYQGGGDIASGGRHVQQLAWLYFGMCDPVRLFSPILSAATSTYHPPEVVTSLALDVAGRGVYEIHQRPLGLVKGNYYVPPDYRMRTDYGGILRYSYCAPEFIMGTAMVEARPMQEWAMISSQNRWHGVVFSGHRNARIVPQCQADDGRVTFNQQWSVQKRGTLICQKLKTSAQCGPMRVWFSGAGLSIPYTVDRCIFVESAGAYAAVRPMRGDFSWEMKKRPPGQWLVLKDDTSPVIIDVVRKTDYANFEAFQAAIRACPMNVTNDVLHYKGVYGDGFTLYLDQSQAPEINGRVVNYAPKKALDSPFLQADWNRGMVSIQKDAHQLILNFNSE